MPQPDLQKSRDMWRNVSLGLLAILFLVVWWWRSQVEAIRASHREQEHNWLLEREGRRLVDQQWSELIERLDLAHDELRREHHRANPTTTKSVDE